MCDSYFSKIFKTKGGDCPKGAVFTQVQVKTARETTLTGCHPRAEKAQHHRARLDKMLMKNHFITKMLTWRKQA